MKLNQKQCKRIIKDIERLAQSLERNGLKIFTFLKGKYGELVVYMKLLELFPEDEIEFKSGQFRSDILVKSSSKEIKIEVKTSSYKEEWYGEGYGVKLNVKKCPKHKGIIHKVILKKKKSELKYMGDFCYFDFLVLVTLKKKGLRTDKIYVFPRKLLWENKKFLKNKSSQYKASSHRLILPFNLTKGYRLNSFEKYLMKNLDKYEGIRVLKKELKSNN